MKTRLAFPLGLLLSCAAGPPPPIPIPIPTPSARVTARIASGHAFAPDTLIMVASWTNVDNGRGPYDSLRVRMVGIEDDTTYVYRLPFPTTLMRARVIPATAYTSISVTHEVYFALTVYQRGTNLAAVFSAPASVVLVGSAPPPGVTGLTLTAVKRP